MSITLSGSDTLTIVNHVFNDFADGNCGELKFPNEIATIKTGKPNTSGVANAIFGYNSQGQIGELTIRLLRGGVDDKFLVGLISSQQNNFSNFPLMFGQYVKVLGDGFQNLTKDTYNLNTGVFTKIPEAMTNVEGDAAQSVAIWTIRFSNVTRVIQ